jgi:GntR family transcriptional regulator
MAAKATLDKGNMQPLYASVYAQLVERIRSGHWTPGQLIPNEFAIAADFGVSQGTARKAIEKLAADKLVVRRQGRGTYVYEHTPDDILCRFLNVFDDKGGRMNPRNRSTKCAVAKATRIEQRALGLQKNTRVIRIDRLRMRGRTPFITEAVTLPEATFPGLADMPKIPDTFYDTFQKNYGVHITRTDERITAVAATAKTAQELEIPPGTPLLRIERTAFALGDRPVEWRVSLCHLHRAHYLANTR